MATPFRNAPLPKEEQPRPQKPSARGSKAGKGKEDWQPALAPKSTEMFAHLPPYKVRGCA